MTSSRDDFERRRAFRITVSLPFAVHQASEPRPDLAETLVNISAVGIAWLGRRPFHRDETVRVSFRLGPDQVVDAAVRIVVSRDDSSSNFWTRAEFTDITPHDRHALERFSVHVQLKRRQQHYAV